MAAIEISNLSKRFKNQTVLSDVNVSFDENAIHGIIGRNGSGKTMLFKCILGLMPFSEGEIRVFGQIIGKDVSTPSNVGMLIETPGFLPNYSGFANLRFLALINNKISNEDIRRAIRTIGLDPGSRKWVGKYSMGMKQRLGIAQAIMENPDLLILDEPMNGLDNRGVDDMRKLFLELKGQGKTILLASHNREDIEILCDCVYEMDAGRLTAILTKNSGPLVDTPARRVLL
ncbi:MAG: ATP-binding cassette domain-containing protein [Clostridia bacterium]|nr:ATP-binding cassette domain-containing protein [Clostridia bacterium]